jgi:hypothetical protein
MLHDYEEKRLTKYLPSAQPFVCTEANLRAQLALPHHYLEIQLGNQELRRSDFGSCEPIFRMSGERQQLLPIF